MSANQHKGNHGDSQELKSKHPNLPIFSSRQPCSKVPFLTVRILSIFIDSTENEFDLVLGQELPVLFIDSNIWEINEEEDADNGGSDSHKSKDDEDPSPAF